MAAPPGKDQFSSKLDPSKLSSYKGELKVGRREAPESEPPRNRRRQLMIGLGLGLIVVLLVIALILVITTMNGPADFAVI